MNNFELVDSRNFKNFQSAQVPCALWVHPGLRMAFNFEALRDAPFVWLDDVTRQEASPGVFLFYVSQGAGLGSEILTKVLEITNQEFLTPQLQWV